MLPNRFQKGKRSKENPGLKIESDSGNNLIPTIRESSDYLKCQTSVKMSVQRFSQEWVISIFGFFVQW